MNVKSKCVNINNSVQNIQIISTKDTNPILLIVHGGPGSPDRPLVKKYNSELAEYYTIVCWDQRGSGLSYSKENLTINLMLLDMKALVEYLRNEYKQDKIYIAGHSWGAYLGLRFVNLYPKYVKYYIGTGQGISSNDETEKYNFVLNKSIEKHDTKVKKHLLEIGKPNPSNYDKSNDNCKNYVTKLVHKYGGYIHPNNSFNMRNYINIYIKDYKINIYKVVKGIKHSLICLQNEMLNNENINITKIEVPIVIITGEMDYICPKETTKAWFDKLEAPNKKFVIIKNASHMVNFEQPKKWNETLISIL